MSHKHEHDQLPDLAEFWESRYAGQDQVWSGKVNGILAEVATMLHPGTALDLGCGEGGDVIWLAQHGWTATGVDISATAVARGRAAAVHLGIAAEAARFEAGDLSTWRPSGLFDLVTCSYLHTFDAAMPREQILRRAVSFVAPGGHLLITSHAAAPPWAKHSERSEHHKHDFPSPREELETLELDSAEWEVVISATQDREAQGPGGITGTVSDTVTLVRRTAEQ